MHMVGTDSGFYPKMRRVLKIFYLLNFYFTSFAFHYNPGWRTTMGTTVTMEDRQLGYYYTNEHTIYKQQVTSFFQ